MAASDSQAPEKQCDGADATIDDATDRLAEQAVAALRSELSLPKLLLRLWSADEAGATGLVDANPEVAALAARLSSAYATSDDGAGETFARIGMPVPLAVLCGALPRCLAQPRLAAVLGVMSEPALAIGGVAATWVEFLVAALAPGGLLPGSAARRLALRMRLTLAALRSPAAALTYPDQRLFALATVPCLASDLRRLATPLSAAEAETMYQRYRCAAALAGLALLPPTLSVASAEAAGAHPPAAPPAALSASLFQHLAYVLPGTSLDLLPATLSNYLLYPERPATELATQLRTAARTHRIPSEGLDDTAVMQRMVRMVAWAMLVGLQGWQPVRGRPGFTVPAALATSWQLPGA